MKNFFKKIGQFLGRFFGSSDSQYPIEPIVTPERPKPEIKTGFNSIGIGELLVDISHHNASVDLNTLKNNVAGVYMKATEGTSFVSPVYVSRITEALKLGIKCGAYHYYKINADPIAQARHFCDYVKGDLPPVLDIEAINNDGYKPKHTADLKLFLDYVEKETGRVPMIYSGFYFLRDVVKPDESFARYPLWLSWYTADRDRVKTPFPWAKINLWQFTETGTVKGITGKCDINIFEGL